MPFDGTGNYSPPSPPTFPAVNGEVIRSDYFNAIITDIANSLTLTFTKDGQSAPTAELDFNNQNLTNIDALDATSVDALNYFINGDLLDYTAFSQDFISSTDANSARAKLGLSAEYVPLTYLDTDTTLAANSDTKIATQKAVKAYVDVQALAKVEAANSGGSSLVGFLQAGTGAVARTAQAKMREVVSVKDFGAVGDGTTDDTAAIHAAFTYALANPTNPLRETGATLTDWGNVTVYFPKGRYKVTSGYDAYAPIGFKIEGDSKSSTSIEYHNDDEAFFDAEIFISLTFQDIAITHVAQDPDRTTWTNRLFYGGGAGGGKNLAFTRVQTRGFNRVIEYRATVNCDVLLCTHCDFEWFNEFLYARNAQAMINKFDVCTIVAYGDLLNIGGYGFTSFDTCSIMIDGTTLKLFGEADIWGDTSVFNFYNTKWEQTNWESKPGGANSALTKLSGDKALIIAQVNLDGCGWQSDFALDATSYQMEVTSNMTVHWNGGTLKPTARILLTPVTISAPTIGVHRGLFFNGMMNVPPPAQIGRGTATAADSFPQVVYEECNGVPNICIGSAGGAAGNATPVTMDRPQQIMQVGRNTHFYAVLTGGSAFVLEQSLHGSYQEIEEVIVDIVHKDAGDLLIETSLDNFATTLDDYTYPINAAADYPAGAYLSKVIAGPTIIGAVSNGTIYVRFSGTFATGRCYVKVRAR